jgi:hypothetical protein
MACLHCSGSVNPSDDLIAFRKWSLVTAFLIQHLNSFSRCLSSAEQSDLPYLQHLGFGTTTKVILEVDMGSKFEEGWMAVWSNV